MDDIKYTIRITGNGTRDEIAKALKQIANDVEFSLTLTRSPRFAGKIQHYVLI